MKLNAKFRPMLGLVPFILMIISFLLAPFLMMILMSIQTEEGSFTLSVFHEVFQNEFYLQSIMNSVTISLASSLVGIIVAILAAYSLTKVSSKVQDVIVALVNMTSNFSGIPLAFSFIIMLGSSGLFVMFGKEFGINALAEFNIFSWTGLTLMYIYFQIPLGIMLLYPAFRGIKEEWQQSASLLGASTLQFWLKIGLPVIAPSIAGVFSILFANAMGAYASAFALIKSNFNILSIQIASLVTGDVFSRTDLASALAVILSMILMTALLFNEYMMRKVRRVS